MGLFGRIRDALFRGIRSDAAASTRVDVETADAGDHLATGTKALVAAGPVTLFSLVRNMLVPLWRAIPLSNTNRIRTRGAVLWALYPLLKNTATYKNHVLAAHAPPLPGPVGARFANDWLIVTTPHNLFIADAVQRELFELGFHVDITCSDADAAKSAHSYHFVISPHHFPSARAGSYVLQLEQLQSPRWNNARYLDSLRRFDAVLDYSEANLKVLSEAGMRYQMMFHMPMDAIAHYNVHRRPMKKDIDVLFYGDINCDRRQKLLAELSQHFAIKVVSGKFGSEMQDLIRRSKVVLNIHYYENARLESVRLFECLSLGTPVVSETTDDVAAYPNLLDVVEFAPVGDAEGLRKAIAELLGSETVYAQRVERIEGLAARSNRFKSHFRRFLLAQGLISFDAFYQTAHGYAPELPREGIPKLYLTLPETPGRMERLQQNGSGLIRFDGLRSNPGWRGCALSYKYLFRHLRDAGVELAIIGEDDALLPPDFEAKLTVILEYLRDLDGQWDVFSGFIADLSPQTTVSNVQFRGGMEFVWLDRAVSTVFNIYASSAIRVMAEWDESNLDPLTNTLDRYMERQGLRFVTTTPFLVGHDEGENSTLWGISNAGYTPLIAATEQLMSQKIGEFRAGAPASARIPPVVLT